MGLRPFALFIAAILGCSKGGAATGRTSDANVSSGADGGAALPDSGPPLGLSDFASPWVFIDQVGPDLLIDALVRTSFGFVAVTHEPTTDGKAFPARSNLAAVSSDGVTWQQHSVGESIHVRGLAAGNGIIVAAGMRFGPGSRGSIALSSDGVTWREVPAPDVGLMTVEFLEGRFWAFGEQGAFFTSSDGVTWADQSRRASVQLNDVAFGNGRFVVVGNVSWLSSADGLDWVEHASICDQPARCPGVQTPGGQVSSLIVLTSVVFGAGTFVTAGAVGPWTSSDGLTWQAEPGALGDSVFQNGQFIARGQNVVVTSDDGHVWRERTSFVASDRNTLGCLDHTCVTYPDGILVVRRLTDPPIAPRLPPLGIDRARSGQTVNVVLGQKIDVSLQTIGPGQYGDPVLSSPAVRLLNAGFAGGPPNPGGPVQVFRFIAESPGTVELRIPHTGSNPEFRLVIEVSPG